MSHRDTEVLSRLEEIAPELKISLKRVLASVALQNRAEDAV